MHIILYISICVYTVGMYTGPQLKIYYKNQDVWCASFAFVMSVQQLTA